MRQHACRQAGGLAPENFLIPAQISSSSRRRFRKFSAKLELLNTEDNGQAGVQSFLVSGSIEVQACRFYTDKNNQVPTIHYYTNYSYWCRLLIWDYLGLSSHNLLCRLWDPLFQTNLYEAIFNLILNIGNASIHQKTRAQNTTVLCIDGNETVSRTGWTHQVDLWARCVSVPPTWSNRTPLAA